MLHLEEQMHTFQKSLQLLTALLVVMWTYIPSKTRLVGLLKRNKGGEVSIFHKIHQQTHLSA